MKTDYHVVARFLIFLSSAQDINAHVKEVRKSPALYNAWLVYPFFPTRNIRLTSTNFLCKLAL